MSLKSILKDNAVGVKSGIGRYHVLDNLDVKKDLKIVIVDGKKRCAIDPSPAILEDFPIVLPGLALSGEISEFKYSKAVRALEEMLDGDTFYPHMVFEVITASGVDLSTKEAQIIESDLRKIGMTEYVNIPPILLEKIIPMINSLYTSGRVSVVGGELSLASEI